MTNLAEKMYVHMQQDVMKEQRTQEAEYQRRVEQLDHQLSLSSFSSTPSSTSALSAVTEFTVEVGQKAVESWWRLFDRLMCKYRDGQTLTTTSLPVNSEPLFYPVWWLQTVGYFVGDIPELHGDQHPPQPPHPEAGLPSPATAAVQQPAISPHHPALGHSWERRRGAALVGAGVEGGERREKGSGGIRKPFEESGVEAEAVVEARVGERGMVGGRSGGVDGSGSAAGGVSLVVWLVGVCSMVSCYVAFRAGRRLEQRKHYQPIY